MKLFENCLGIFCPCFGIHKNASKNGKTNEQMLKLDLWCFSSIEWTLDWGKMQSNPLVTTLKFMETHQSIVFDSCECVCAFFVVIYFSELKMKQTFSYNQSISSIHCDEGFCVPLSFVVTVIVITEIEPIKRQHNKPLHWKENTKLNSCWRLFATPRQLFRNLLIAQFRGKFM